MRNTRKTPNTTCAYCQIPFYKKPSEIKKYKHTFCSTKCYGKFSSHPLTCIICGKEYPRKFHKKTCSRSCANKHRSGIKYKVNRPRDKVAYSTGLKIRLLSERGSSCQRCNFPKTEILIVHHKDRDRTNNNLKNLELICPNCHAEEHYLEKNWLKRYNVQEFKEKLLLKESAYFIYRTERSPSGLWQKS